MLAPGTIVGGYRIELLLGRGAMGEVYRAVQLALDRPVAVKRIAGHLLDQPGAVARFEREARCLARVHCEHVVAVHDFGRFADQQGGEHWLIVMELVEGMSLGKVLATRGRLPWPEATVIARQVADGLAAVAEFGVVHRDLKPDNILVSRRGVAKITDFGLARASDSSTMTAEGAMLGTPLYMPPEACRGENADARGDLYSLGCTWFHCLVGQPPFRATSSIALLRLHLEQPVPDVAAAVADLPPDLVALLTALMAKEPADRPATAIAASAAIAASSAAAQLPRLIDVSALPMAEQPTIIPLNSTPITEPLTTPTRPAANSTAATLVASATGSITAPVAATVPPTTARRPGSLLIVAIALILAGVGLAAGLMLGGKRADHDVTKALAAGDTSLALQRAAAALEASPGDAGATALVRRAIDAEVARLCKETRHDDAIARLQEHRARWSWLDTGGWEKQIAIDRGHALVRQGRIRDAFDAFLALRERNVQDLDVARAILAAFPEHNQDGLVMVSAALLVEHGGEAVDSRAMALLVGSMAWDGPFSPRTKRNRDLLLKHHPDPSGIARPLLDHAEHEARENGRALLQAAGTLTPAEELRYHWRTTMELSTSYGVTRDSLAWLTQAVAAPDWAERKELAKPGPVPDPVPALAYWNDHANALIDVLISGFSAEILHPAMRWTVAEDQQLRWNAYRILERLDALDRIDRDVFHHRTLVTFDPLYDSPDFQAALAWCAATTMTTRAAGARRALQLGDEYVVTHYRRHRQANNERGSVACKERIRAINETYGRIKVP